jgi:hypothetical protein
MRGFGKSKETHRPEVKHPTPHPKTAVRFFRLTELRYNNFLGGFSGLPPVLEFPVS